MLAPTSIKPKTAPENTPEVFKAQLFKSTKAKKTNKIKELKQEKAQTQKLTINDSGKQAPLKEESR